MAAALQQLKQWWWWLLATAKTEHGEQTTIRDEEGGGESHSFTYDHAFWSTDANGPDFADQAAVYDAIGRPIVASALDGFNSTLFAYGQTGSGKSFTMLGSADDPGITPRLCDDLFQQIATLHEPGYEVTVECSYFEIYSEKVYDLLGRSRDPSGKSKEKEHGRGRRGEVAPLRVRESPVVGPYVEGLTSVPVASFEDVVPLLDQGSKVRHVAATAMNAESSRSHAIFTLTVRQGLVSEGGAEDDDTEKSAKVNLVDLAGSERQDKTLATGVTRLEASAINRSLTALGMVVTALVKKSGATTKTKSHHIPYRDSVLTWILRESFGGNSRTAMIATISPSMDNYDETLSTLRYADNAKHIVNTAVKNEGASAKIIRELKEQIEALQARVSSRDTAAEGAAGTAEAELAEARALLVQKRMSSEERLETARAEMAEMLAHIEEERDVAEHRAEELEENASRLQGQLSGMRWRATAQLCAMQRELTSLRQAGAVPRSESDDPTVLRECLAEERRRVEVLQAQLDELLALLPSNGASPPNVEDLKRWIEHTVAMGGPRNDGNDSGLSDGLRAATPRRENLDDTTARDQSTPIPASERSLDHSIASSAGTANDSATASAEPTPESSFVATPTAATTGLHSAGMSTAVPSADLASLQTAIASQRAEFAVVLAREAETHRAAAVIAESELIKAKSEGVLLQFKVRDLEREATRRGAEIQLLQDAQRAERGHRANDFDALCFPEIEAKSMMKATGAGHRDPPTHGQPATNMSHSGRSVGEHRTAGQCHLEQPESGGDRRMSVTDKALTTHAIDAAHFRDCIQTDPDSGGVGALGNGREEAATQTGPVFGVDAQLDRDPDVPWLLWWMLWIK